MLRRYPGSEQGRRFTNERRRTLASIWSSFFVYSTSSATSSKVACNDLDGVYYFLRSQRTVSPKDKGIKWHAGVMGVLNPSIF